jgi:hypothetical protein
MRIFHCNHCRHLVFFENTQCVKCKHALAYLPDLGFMGSLDPTGDGAWRSPLRLAAGRTYRLCANYDAGRDVCNWAIPADDPDPLCRSCRLTRVIPDLGREGAKAAWYKLEAAKRRVIYSLMHLGVAIVSRADDHERGLAFEFLAEPAEPDAPPVLTGHSSGVITLNIAEADDAERERRRLQLGEPYRTVLGHFRHEIGHYYWAWLIESGPRLDPFRALFGDERADYAAGLERHHAGGPPPDWQARFVTAYASAHPWEDWAETWAHYLHLTDTLEMAAACGVSLEPWREGDPRIEAAAIPDKPERASFDELMDGWFPLTYLLNNLNRGLGLPDGYPFVLSEPALAKLRFVHDTIAESARRQKLIEIATQ